MPSELPLAVSAYVFLVGVVFCRAGATYLLGRWVRRAGDASRWADRLSRPMLRRSERIVARYGAPAVSASFLTVGVQSAVNLSAGLLRMPVRRYLPALAVGAMIWAGIYLSLGIALLEAWSAGRTVPAAAAAVVLVGVFATVAIVLRRRWFGSSRGAEQTRSRPELAA